MNGIAALTLANGGAALSAFTRPQLDALAYLGLRLHGQGVTVASVFWGLWLFPFGLLVIRCGFIPRILGVLLIVAGIAYLATAAATLVATPYASIVSTVCAPLIVAEVPIIFWLAFWGARTPVAAPWPRQ